MMRSAMRGGRTAHLLFFVLLQLLYVANSFSPSFRPSTGSIQTINASTRRKSPLFFSGTPPGNPSDFAGNASGLTQIFTLASLAKKLKSRLLVDRESHLPQSIPMKKKRFLRQRIIRNLSEWCFDTCDGDHSGYLTYDEVYAGVLLAHLHLARYCGIAALYPPSRDQVVDFCRKVDPKDREKVGRTEFREVVMLTLAHLSSRIFLYYGLLVFLVPFVASRIVTRLPMIHSVIVEHSLALVFCVGVIPSAFAFVDRTIHLILDPFKARSYKK